jgi:hypothetical protein
MAHRGRILRTAAVAALLAALSLPPGGLGLDTTNEAPRGPECDSVVDGASALPAQAPGRIIDVAGIYTVTSTDVLMPGTEGALRVIEFTVDSAASPAGGGP